MIKHYEGLTEDANYEVNLNRICNGSTFKQFIASRHGICPRGLTVSCYENENNVLVFLPEIKYYGYDSLSNNGTEYTDLGDYTGGPVVKSEICETIFEYFFKYEPEIYKVMNENIYKI